MSKGFTFRQFLAFSSIFKPFWPLSKNTFLQTSVNNPPQKAVILPKRCCAPLIKIQDLRPLAPSPQVHVRPSGPLDSLISVYN